MKKMNNKGFSMVELIIVIAIMAILAAALAPALIKYINKSRLSTDISTGTSLASAIQTALTNESAYDTCATIGTQGNPVALSSVSWDTSGTNMKDAVEETIDLSNCVVKSKKTMSDGNGGAAVSLSSPTFGVVVDATSNLVEVYIMDASNKFMVSPSVNTALTE